MRVKIKVTEDCISKGRPHQVRFCPVALAIRGIIGAMEYVSVEKDIVYLRPPHPNEVNGPKSSSLLPRSAKRFIKKFDSWHPVQPFNFFINIDEKFCIVHGIGK